MKPDAAARPGVYVSLVTYDTLRVHGRGCLERCLAGIFGQRGFSPGEDLVVQIHDNGSADRLWQEAAAPHAGPGLKLSRSAANLGFCGGHNLNLRRFLEGSLKYFLVLNPDVFLEADALRHLAAALEEIPAAGAATPCLFRAGSDFQPLQPRILDAAGMFMTRALRHFDRGSGEVDRGQYRRAGFVFGGSGACLLLRREFIRDAMLDAGPREGDLARIYPALAGGRGERALLFDEAFLAYREDADLAWRGQLLGWRCVYVPAAAGYHRRVVLPEKRGSLSPELNLYGVRNRFLMQINNFFLHYSWPALLPGLLLRNLLVVLGVLFWERSSLPALGHVIRLAGRGRARRRALARRIRIGPCEMAEWFRRGPRFEGLEGGSLDGR